MYYFFIFVVYLVRDKILGNRLWQNISPLHSNTWKYSKSVLTYLEQLLATFQTQIRAVCGLQRLCP